MEETLDDLMRSVMAEIQARGVRVEPTRGTSREIAGVLLELTNPRSRLSLSETRGVLFSCLGEFLWYMAGSDRLEFIEYYISGYRRSADAGVIHGAYGPRLQRMRGVDQLSEVLTRLREKPSSRRAVIQLFCAEDIASSKKDIPCTCTLQFLIRDQKLHLITHMRSNDVVLGLPHDVFCFTMLQEYVARQLSVALGGYKHFVGSLHLYDTDSAKADYYLSEGWQSTLEPMPPMPGGDPCPSMKALLRMESAIRSGLGVTDGELGSLAEYWADIVLLLRAWGGIKSRDLHALREARERLSSPLYGQFLDEKIRKLERAE